LGKKAESADKNNYVPSAALSYQSGKEAAFDYNTL
jgi:hypothetical protein